MVVLNSQDVFMRYLASEIFALVTQYYSEKLLDEVSHRGVLYCEQGTSSVVSNRPRVHVFNNNSIPESNTIAL